MVSEQIAQDEMEQTPTARGRQCSGCHRRGASHLTLHENGKLYCANCALNIGKLGIKPVVIDDDEAPNTARSDDHEPDATDEPIHDAHVEGADAPAVATDEPESSPHPEPETPIAASIEPDIDQPEPVQIAPAAGQDIQKEEPPMPAEPRPLDQIAALPSLAPSAHSLHQPAPVGDISLEGVLAAERARLLEQRAEIERRFHADVQAIDARLVHVESLLGEKPERLAS